MCTAQLVGVEEFIMWLDDHFHKVRHGGNMPCESPNLLCYRMLRGVSHPFLP